jgi:glutathione synthase/RimK-type ligase-like ATP-grasp enzyme
MTAILILTQPEDAHTQAVAVALEQKGARVVCWYTSDFPSRESESVEFFDRRCKMRNSAVPDLEYSVVWNRRPAFVIDPETLHRADVLFAERNCREFRKSFFDLYQPQARWVNPHEKVRRLTKLLQFHHAQGVGWDLPHTLFGNEPGEIRTFLAQNQECGVVYKPLTGLPWKDEDTYWVPYTTEVEPADLPADAVLRMVPGIYQARIEKRFELRVTVMGRTLFAVKIDSQGTEKGRLDWRKAYDELEMQEFQLPAAVEAKCFALLESLGLVFGCLDLIVTPEGDYVFLEVNQMGQFLFLERYVDLPLLDAFSDFLTVGSSDFMWRRRSPRIRYEDVRSLVGARLDEEKEQHALIPESAFQE